MNANRSPLALSRPLHGRQLTRAAAETLSAYRSKISTARAQSHVRANISEQGRGKKVVKKSTLEEILGVIKAI